MPVTRAITKKSAPEEEPDGVTYFELLTEIEPDDLPRPIQVPATDGHKAFVIRPMTAQRMFDLREAVKAGDMNGYDRAVLGDAFEAAIAMYGGKPRAFWLRFIGNVESHFYGRGASKAAAPGKSPASPA